MMYNKKIILTVKKEIIERYNDKFILSKLMENKKYFYDNCNMWNFDIILFNELLINFEDNIQILIHCKFIEIIFRWLKLKQIKFNIEDNGIKIKRIFIDLNYNISDMKILFQILDFMILFDKKYGA